MVLPRKLRDYLLSAALLAVPILFLQANLKEPAELSPIDRAILRISAPIQAAVTGAVSAIHTGWRRYVYLVGVEEENEELRREKRELQAQLRDAKRGVGRLKHLERLLRFRESHAVETIGIRVIGRDSSPFVRMLRVQVDRGGEVLRKGQPVVTAEGVVGRIGRVYGSYSEVVLAVDPKSAIDVVIQRTGGRGVLRGIEGKNRYVCRIDYLLRKEEVKKGDLVVTSGVASVFPKDLPVGRISNVTRRTYGLYQEVEVTPAVDMSSLREMLVILSPPPPTVSGDTDRGSAAPARGFTP
jgi:rod shape-determining protein MreC